MTAMNSDKQDCQLRGRLLSDFYVSIDPRSTDLGGTWSLDSTNGKPVALDIPTLEFFCRQVSSLKRKRFLDIGANTGGFCLLGKVLPGLTGFAFEPNPEVFPILVRNLQLNGLDKSILPIQASVGDRHARAMLKIPLESQSGLAVLGTPIRFKQWREVEVQMLPLDDFCKSQMADGVDIIKIDTEGCELPILLGARGVLEQNLPDILLELYADNTRQFGYEPEEILRFMNVLNYAWTPVGEYDFYFRHRSKLHGVK
jgi:FkbM family methyltransferase